VAVVTFMATGIATASFCPHDNFLYVSSSSTVDKTEAVASIMSALAACIAIFIALRKSTKAAVHEEQKRLLPVLSEKEAENNAKKAPIAALSASIFAVGLAISGMTKQNKIFGFLDVTKIATGTWDGTLLLVMGGGVLFSAASYHWVEGFNFFKNDNVFACPPLHDKSACKFNVPARGGKIDSQLVLAAALFGIGWGIGGLCPGPALFVAASGFYKVLFYWWPAHFIGALLSEEVKKRSSSCEWCWDFA